MSFIGKWQRTDAAKDLYAIEKQLGDGNLPTTRIIEVDVPAASALPDAFVSDTYTPRNHQASEVVIVSGIPFKIGGVYVFLAADTEESTAGTGVLRADRLLVRADPGITFAPGESIYIEDTAGATQGLATNLADSGTNLEVGVCLSKDADKAVFAAGAQSAGIDLNFILPNGEYIWIMKTK